MSNASPSGATVPELIRLREQLTGWIAKLDQVGPQASSAVAERVRADYHERLRRVNEELGAHSEEIASDLASFREALAAAEERRGVAGEALEEARLRHLIGELDEEAWNESRPELERDVSDADAAVAQARSEVERLEALSGDIRGAAEAAAAPEVEAVWTAEEEIEPAPAPAPEAEPEAEPEPEPFVAEAPAPPPPPAEEAPPAADVREAADAVSADEWDPFGGEFAAEKKQDDAGEDLPWLSGAPAPAPWTAPEEESGLEFLRGIDEPAPAAPETPDAAAADDLGADDLAFLEELDRSIGGSARPPSGAAPQSPQSSQPPQPAPAAEPAVPAGASRTEPLLCKECGAINEPHSWYCEICGSEL